MCRLFKLSIIDISQRCINGVTTSLEAVSLITLCEALDRVILNIIHLKILFLNISKYILYYVNEKYTEMKSC